jgi:hypothetical protein
MSGCSTASVQAYEDCGASAQGLLPYDATDINTKAIQAAVASATPNGAPSSFKVVAEAMLRSGGLIYYKSNPGDCGTPSPIPGIGVPQIAGLSGSAGSGVVGGLGAAGIISGPLTLGIGAAITVGVGAIEQIFAHHSEAVANEQATICAVVNFFNKYKKQIDVAVQTGQISPDQGAQYLIQIANQAQTGLSSIEKTCDAACVYAAICQAFMNFCHTWYDSIAPAGYIFPQQPGGAPTAMGTPPGGVTATPSNPAPLAPIRSLPQNTYLPAGPGTVAPLAPQLTINSALPGNVRAPDYLNLGYNQQTGQSGQAADVPSFAVNWTMIGAIAAVIALLIVARR